MFSYVRNIASHPIQVSAFFIIFFMSFFILAYLAVGFVWPLYLLAVGAGFFISVFYPKSGVLSVIFLTMIFERFFTLQPLFIGKEEYKLYPLDVVLVGVIAGLFLQRFRKSFSFSFCRAKKEHCALAGFIVLNVIYFAASVEMLGADYAISFSTLKNYAFYSLMYFVMIALVKEKKDIEEIAQFFFLGAVGIIMFIFLGLIRGEGLWSEYTPLSTSGVRTLAFPHGLYLTLAFAAAFLYKIFYHKHVLRPPWLFFVWLTGILGTMMRHLWIGLAVSLSIVYFMLKLHGKQGYQREALQLAGLLFFCAVTFFYIASLFPQSHFSSLTTSAIESLGERVYSLENLSGDESYSWRNLVWNSAWQKYKQHPVLGIGTGQKVSVESGSYHDFVEIKNIHNSYLSILVQLGIMGFAVFFYFLAVNIYALIKSLLNEAYAGYKFAILGIIGVYIIGFAFQPYLETNVLAIFFWMSLGTGAAVIKMN